MAGKNIERSLSLQETAENHGLPISVSGIPPLSHSSFKVHNALAAKAYFIQFMIAEGFLASNLY